ncbi:nyn domain-containing protein [Gigaspora margarita]|uniref:Nyn domain-containing protein n=1 Tax=Gigaspora margarita TaxID=4874 RepID=A0A8H4ANH6_GIGMA|nr:nyn domain-containing protein [Gigaspora margarita]
MDNSNLFVKGKYSVSRLEEAGRNLVIVGSHSPLNDSLWNQIHQQDFYMKVYNRNIANKEKKVDIELEACILEWALDYDWKVEVWFWLLGMQDSTGKNYILEITNNKTLVKWKDDKNKFEKSAKLDEI